jgi:tetratricopeptide (TPR) repeat protein
MTQITRWLSAILVSTLPGAPLALAQEPPAPPAAEQPEPPPVPPQPTEPAEPTNQDQPPAATTPSSAAASDAYQRGLTAYRNRNFSQALQEFAAVLEAEPDRADVHYLMGYSHYMLKHFQDSLDSFRLAFELDPELDPRGIYQARYRTGGS